MPHALLKIASVGHRGLESLVAGVRRGDEHLSADRPEAII
jgi:hypothetical protein